MITLNHYIDQYSKERPDHLAVVSAYEEVTYGQLGNEVPVISGYLQSLGLKSGDSICMLSRNSTSYLKLWYAAIRIGILTVPLHIRVTPEEHVEMADTAGCRFIFYSDEFRERADEIAKKSQCITAAIYIDTFCHSSFYEKNASLRTDMICTDPDNAALLLYTSGTTGVHKGVIRTQQMLSLHARSLYEEEGFVHDDPVMLTTSPFFHSAGILSAYRMLASGGTLVIPARLDPAKVITLIRRYHPTSMHLLPPATYERIYDSMLWEDCDLSFVSEVCLSAGKCTADNIEHIFRMFPNCMLRPSWGATETGTVTSAHIGKDALLTSKVPVSAIIGKVMPYNEIRIVDDALCDVPDGLEGEALVRSPVVCSRYINKKNSPEFLENGWFRTGDILRYHSDTGYYEFVDRMKDIIKTGGENVSSLKIERAAGDYESVKECAAVGVTDRKLGEAIGIVVVVKEGASFHTDDFLDVCRRRLSKMEMPRYLLFLDELPRNGIGKVQKTVLRTMENSFIKL